MTALERLRRAILWGEACPEDTQHFHFVIGEVIDLLFLPVDLAHLFGMSRASVSRWVNKRNAPHPKMRGHVYAKLLHVVNNRESFE